MGSKIFLSVVTALLTSIFLGSLGIGIRASELGQKHEVRISLIEQFVKNQNDLNSKLGALIQSQVELEVFRRAAEVKEINIIHERHSEHSTA